MIYQFDQALPMPTKDLYDTSVMQMAIAAAKDMYDRGEKRINDFYKKYEDFYSPISGATEDVYNTGIGKIKGVISDLYAQGVDPLRSPEGRAAVQRAIRDVDVARINARKQEAEFAKQYIKNRDIAIMNGTYDPDVERAVNGGKLLEEWTAQDGYWKSTAPIKYMSQDDIISPLAKSLSPEFDPIRTAQENNGYDYKTVSENRIRQMVNDNIDDLITKSTMGKYYYDQALKAAGNDPKLARQMLIEQYVQTAKKYTKEDRELNQYAYQKAQADERRRAAKEQAALAYQYKQLENWDFDGNGALDADELDAKRRYKEAQIEHYKNMGNRSRTSDGYPNIFDEADRKPETMIGFDSKNTYANKIDPNDDSITLNASGTYTIAKKDIGRIIDSEEIISDTGKPFKKGTYGTKQALYVIPAGGVIRKRTGRRDPETGKPEYAYYMRVQLQYQDGTIVQNNKEVPNYKPVTDESMGYALMRIKERDANYGEQQKKDKSVDTGN